MLAADGADGMDYTQLLKDVFGGDIVAGEISPAFVKGMAEKYMKAVFSGYGQNLSKIDYDTPDYNMLANLEKNVYAFSGAKNYQQVKELTTLVKDSKTFADFKEATKAVVDEYNQHLRTEYETAIGGGQMAAKWVDFEQGAEDMPFLKYETVGDQRVRESHRRLDGVVKKIDDSFWKKYYPPNGWNCRCTVIQLPTAHAHETPDKQITYPDVPKMWQVNTAQQNIIFPEGSPVFVGVPADIKQQVFELLPPDRRFETIYEGKNGGIVRQHIDVNIKDSDYHYLHDMAIDKANKGDVVKMMPHYDDENSPNIPVLFKGAKPGKQPDFNINGKWVEVEGVTKDKLSTISTAIGNGYEQANEVVINLKKPVLEHDLYRVAKGRLKTHTDLNSVEFYYKGKSVAKFP